MRLSYGRHEIDVSNPDKVFYPEAGLTKGDLVDYYRRIARIMLPYVAGRPVAMKRYPDGIDGGSFFQKEVPDHFPDWIERAPVPKEEGGVVNQAVLRDEADLVYLADQACITPHVWLATADHLDRPDRMIFDLDPPDGGVDIIRRAARAVREVLTDVGLSPFVMTSGSRGYHVWVPLDAGADFDTVRGFARAVAEVVVARDPDFFTIEQRIGKRGDRVLIDYLRNAYGQTSAPPYAARARPGAPVATPLDWDELSRTEPQRFAIGNLFRRIGRKADPWRDLSRHARPLPEPPAP